MRNSRQIFFLLFLLFQFIPAQALELKGVGRKVPGELFDAWGKQYSSQNEGIEIKFEYAGANEVVKRIEEGKADFGDSDFPLSKSDLDKRGITQFPYMFTAIVPVINLPGVYNAQMHLDGKVLADIFLGKISKWNDPAIVELNPKLPLPDEKILVFHGNENASGNFPLNNYLSKVSPDWASRAGATYPINWPVGTALPDILDVGSVVKKTPFSIGYTEVSFARKNNIVYTQMKNSEGRFVSPHTGSVESAMMNVSWKPKNGFHENISDEKGAGSWPIISVSYIFIHKTSNNIQHRLALLKFLGWGIGFGDIIVTNLDFMPVNRSILPMIRSAWNDTPLVIEGAEVVTAKQVNEMRGSKVLIVDARVNHEYLESHIPGAVNIPYGEKSEKSVNFNPQVDKFDLSQLPENKNAQIVFYCNAGACWKGYKAAVVAINAGYKKVYWFRGGLPEWQSRSFPIDTSIATSATGKKS